MKLRLFSAIFLFALTNPVLAAQPGKLYAGAFGGSGPSNHFNTSQFGTVFFTEAAGGPLAVNAFGQLTKKSAAFFGAQLGYHAQGIIIYSCSPWTLGPAAELEGYYMSKSSFTGTLINNTARLDEHDFLVSYPMRRTVFLANAVLNFNHSRFFIHPYVGFGIGNAIIRISGANATQANPPEANINHYNTKNNDTNSTFAGQIKIGLSFDINQHFSLIADYRWLYLGNTNFTFGSTVNPTHVETSSWQVNIDSQRYNLFNIGIRFCL